MIRVLVTGSRGQLGMTLQELGTNYPDLVFRFMDKSDLDITHPDEVNKAFRDFKPEYCINCAAYTLVDQAERTPEPAYEVNVKGVMNLVATCKEYGTILIHISTDYVFDGTKKEGYTPADKPNPINVYGRTKWEGEQIVQKELNRYFIVRTSWLYSKTYGHNFYKTILSQAKAGKTITVTDAQRGCPTDATNLTRYILELISVESIEYGITHYTDGEAMSWYEFARAILKTNELGNKVRIVKDNNYTTFAPRPINSVLRH